MLIEFEGTIDAQGLRTFRKCSELQAPASRDLRDEQLSLAFWAVLESQAATSILGELFSGNRHRALRLLEEEAVSLGTVLD